MSGKVGYDAETAVASRRADGQNSWYREKNGWTKQNVHITPDIILVLCPYMRGIICYNSSSSLADSVRCACSDNTGGSVTSSSRNNSVIYRRWKHLGYPDEGRNKNPKYVRQTNTQQPRRLLAWIRPVLLDFSWRKRRLEIYALPSVVWCQFETWNVVSDTPAGVRIGGFGMLWRTNIAQKNKVGIKFGQKYTAIPTIVRMNTGLRCEAFPGEREILICVLIRELYVPICDVKHGVGHAHICENRCFRSCGKETIPTDVFFWQNNFFFAPKIKAGTSLGQR